VSYTPNSGGGLQEQTPRLVDIAAATAQCLTAEQRQFSHSGSQQGSSRTDKPSACYTPVQIIRPVASMGASPPSLSATPQPPPPVYQASVHHFHVIRPEGDQAHLAAHNLLGDMSGRTASSAPMPVPLHAVAQALQQNSPPAPAYRPITSGGTVVRNGCGPGGHNHSARGLSPRGSPVSGSRTIV